MNIMLLQWKLQVLRKSKNIFDKQPLTKNSEFGISIIDKDKNIILDQYGFKSKEKQTMKMLTMH